MTYDLRFVLTIIRCVLSKNGFDLNRTGFILNMTGSVLNMTRFVLNSIGSVLNMTGFVFNMTCFFINYGWICPKYDCINVQTFWNILVLLVLLTFTHFLREKCEVLPNYFC